MAKFDIFVGREEELDLIDKWARRWGQSHLIVIGGEGGIGKTFLLHKVMETYAARDDFAVVYYDLSEQPPGTLREVLHIADALDWENFPEFQVEITDLASGEYDVADIRLPQLEQNALLTFVKELGDFMLHKRLIRLTDTLDAVEVGRAQRAEFYRYANVLPNVLAVAAGREAAAFLPEFEEAFDEEAITYVELESFDQVESEKFFDEVDPQGSIAPDIREKLHFLAGGRPILLSLAVEWLARSMPLPDMVELSVGDLMASEDASSSEALRDLRQRFEFELVDRIRQLKMPLDRAVLYMAHISRRSDASILATLLNLSPPQAEQLMQQLAELSFVRYNPTTQSCMLHDEMKHLVNRYAWPYIDATGDLRRALTRKVITDYYEPRIRALAEQNKPPSALKGPIRRTAISQTEWAQWRLEAECLYYHLKISEEDGLAYFDERFAEAERNNHLMRMQFLRGEMDVAGPGIRDTLELRRAAELRLRGEVEEAREICETLLARGHLSIDNRISAHNTLGLIAASSDPERARRHYRRALSHAQRGNRVRVMGVLHNNLGQLHSYINRLDQAIEHYEEAITYSKRAANEPLVASATNNLAYIYRLKGDLAKANVLCRVALGQRQRLGLERDLAYSYLTKGEVDRDRGNLESAERYTKLALRIFDKVEEITGQIMAYNALANIRRHMDQYDEAEAYLDRGIALAEQINNEPLLADLLNIYGREQRDRAVYMRRSNGDADAEVIRALFESAEAYLERSLAMSSRYGDQWLIVRSRFELALAFFLSASQPDDEILAMLQRIWDEAADLGYVLLQGYVEEVRGEIAHRRGDYEAAAPYFGRAALWVAQRRGREPERFFERLADCLLDTDLSPETACTLARGILDVIQGEFDEGVAAVDAYNPLESLRMLCTQILETHAC
jgi:tetratricopeptide (TPR) repeat protein